MTQVEGYIFNHTKLFKLAMMHPSMKKTAKTESYERLEFLGDKVLGLVIADIVYNKFGNLPEGKLSLIHSNLVKTEMLAKIALRLGLDKKIKMDLSEENNKGRTNKGNMEDVLEALLGAIYLDGGYEAAKNFINMHWSEFITNDMAHMKRDAKSALQEWAQKNGNPLPEYAVIGQSGSDHEPFFNIEVKVPGFEPVAGRGKSKKLAQLDAATNFLQMIEGENEL